MPEDRIQATDGDGNSDAVEIDPQEWLEEAAPANAGDSEEDAPARTAAADVPLLKHFVGMSDVLARWQRPPVFRPPAMPPIVYSNPQLEALIGVRSEVAGLAAITKATGEQIAATANLTAATVEALANVHAELKLSRTSADRSARLITRLTWALVVLTVVLVGLTAALILKHGG